jgi:chromosome segregation ATPase
VTALYSLYDALIGINVPTEKARAVVDAMERDMSEFLATKSDITLVRQDLDASRAATKSDIALFRQDLDASLAATKSDIALVRQELDALRASTQGEFTRVRQELDALRASTQGEFTLVRQELDALRASTHGEFTLVRQELGGAIALLAKDNQRLAERMEQKFELQRASLIIWLGSMQVVGIGLLYSLLKLGH